LLRKLLLAKDSAIVSQFAGRKIVREPVPLQKGEPLRLELEHFVESARVHRTPRVTGEAAKQALELALEITRQAARQVAEGLPEAGLKRGQEG
jgi:predicted dehydrogenase